MCDQATSDGYIIRISRADNIEEKTALLIEAEKMGCYLQFDGRGLIEDYLRRKFDSALTLDEKMRILTEEIIWVGFASFAEDTSRPDKDQTRTR